MPYWVYILAHKKHGALYVGMTSDLSMRLDQHRHGLHSAHTRKYSIHRLVYAEEHADVSEAQTRERRIKRWRRGWKITLIENQNPDWNDLADTL